MRINREEGQIDEVLHQQHQQDINYQLLLMQIDNEKGVFDERLEMNRPEINF